MDVEQPALGVIRPWPEPRGWVFARVQGQTPMMTEHQKTDDLGLTGVKSRLK